MHVPFTCARTSGVEIRGDCEHITKAICDEELSSSSPRARAVRPSWFVMSVHSCPQLSTAHNKQLGPPVPW